MKFIGLLLALSLILSADNFGDMKGTWKVSSLEYGKSVTFGKDRNRERGGSIIVSFNREQALVDNGRNYFYRVYLGMLQITDKEINFERDRHNRIDTLKIMGTLRGGCKQVKYMKKGLGGSYYKKGYRMCKIENYPSPVYIREKY